MPQLVTGGAVLRCSFGTLPSQLIVTPEKCVGSGPSAAASTLDYVPMKNILPFGLCVTGSNPQVSAAWGAPQPCIPVTTAPWTPGSPTVTVAGQPVLHSACQLLCQWGGVIAVAQPGQATVTTA